MIDRPLVKGTNTGTVIVPTGSSVSQIVSRAWVSVRCDGGGSVAVWFQKSKATMGSPPGAGSPWTNADGSPVAFQHAERPWREVPAGTEYLMYQVNANGPGALCVELLAQ